MQSKSIWQLRNTKHSLPGNVRSILPLLLLLGRFFLPATLLAAGPNPSTDSIDTDVRYVDCGSTNKPINSINNALASLDPSEDNTIYVKGACKENVNIGGFDRLKLIAQNGASISDASGDTAAALSIDNSTRVSVQGFTINGSGPNAQTEAIDCTFSYCAFSGDMFQNNNGGGIVVSQNGFVVAIGVTLQKNGQGATVAGGFLQINSSTVQNNVGTGVVVRLGGTVNMFTSTVTGNGGNGINVTGHSTLQLGFPGTGNGGPGSSVTNNSGAGVLVMDLSFANFVNGVSNVVKNNLGGTDVLCSPQFPATRGAHTNIGGGSTNCVEP